MNKRLVCVLTIFGCIVSSSIAQVQDTLEWHQIREVSVEDNFGQNRSHLTSTAPLQVLSHKEINSLGFNQLSEALNLMNGVTVKDYGGIGGMKTVSIRNLGAEHTAVVYDGVPVSDCQAGKIDISRFSTDNLKEIRLGIGASEEMLMAASVEPFSGSLVLSTRVIEGTEVNVSAGSFATLNAGVSHTRKGLNASVKYSHTDGNYPFTLTNGELKTRERRNNGRVDNANAEVNYNIKAHGATISNKAYFYYSDRELPGGIVFYKGENHETLQDKNYFVQSKYSQSFGQRFEIQALAKYNRGENRYFDGNQIADNGITMHHFNYRQNEGLASVGGSVKGNGLTVSLVSDVLFNSLNTNIPEYDNKHRTTIYTALRSHYRKGDFNIHGSLIHTALNDVTDRQKLTPSIAVNWSPKWLQCPSDGLYMALRASWREAFRLPTFNDMYYYRLGNHDLRPEETKESNLGLTFSVKGLSVTADVFYNKVKDLIVAVPTTFAWRMSNFGKVDIKGINIAAGYSLKQVMLNANYSLNVAKDLTDPSSKYYRCQIPYTARNSGSVSAIWDNKWVTIGYSMQWMGKRYSSIMHERFYLLKSYQDHDISVSKNFGYKGCNIETSIAVKNIFDCQYDIIQYYPMPGRQVMANIKICI